ncbi:hypothetical protein R1sor_021625 [Riccia sorocarpa]|uniref:Uncharacterized protein n=1 Tax=Riccia sorocarpa TaxID=122646 RepID=A0ABD3GLT6_9MARC
MARPEFKLDTSDVAIQNTLKRLSDAQQLEPPVGRSRQVQLTPAPEHESLKDILMTAVVTAFYGPSPQLDQFKACIGDAWGSLENVRILQTRAMARRGMFFTRLDSHLPQLRVLRVSSPVIKGAQSVTLPYLPEIESLSSFLRFGRYGSSCQKHSLASVRALILWDFRQSLIEELSYTVDGFPFRLKLRLLELGEACTACGFSQVQGCKCNRGPPSAADPIPPCPAGPTDIVIEEFQRLNQGPMAIQDNPSSREAAWRENTDLHHVSFVQLLNQQSLGAYEANQREGVQPMEEEVQSSHSVGQVGSLRAAHRE